MAVKWAVANGSWNAGATWNDGVVPVDGDIIYLNGHIVGKGSHNINLPNAILTNGANAEYGIVAGGYINMNNYNYNNITINLRASGTYVYYLSDQQSNRDFTINGNVEVVDNCTPLHYYINSSNIRIIINGNISLKNLPLIVRSGGNVVHSETIINGNVTGEQGATIYSYSTSGRVLINGNVNNVSITQTSVTINGNLSLIDNNFTTSNQTLTINGNLSLLNGHYINCGTLNYSGSEITYSGYAVGSIGNIKCENVLFSDTNNLIWRDVSVVRTAPFIIVTDAEINNRQQYPAENEVKEGTEYVWGEKVGTYQQPPESVVLKGFVYDNGDKVGTLENQTQVGCVTKEDVREGVPLIGMYEDGQQVVGTIVIPAEEDVREGVHYDNNKVGTLIVQGGGDRLRIADFGYYTRSTSITYIVDLTESDKPAFADCEEIVLQSLFPTLDLNNIPDKFFDDLFVQFLRYRLLVEYYRGTSINSKFTPSEPAAEIVNYANTKCEYWLNTANLFLQLWGEKYPNSVKRDRIFL